MNTANINSLWASLIIEELVRLGVTYFCVSPGSRSAPLTVAAAQSESVRVLMHFDERGAVFHALGYARATERPAALICTSGTAAANYLPAIVEASMSSIPM
ncbi:MAG: thiamine pyrophosphate-binding protein, partial [Candidatus Zixiibacteriota bacterium]